MSLTTWDSKLARTREILVAHVEGLTAHIAAVDAQKETLEGIADPTQEILDCIEDNGQCCSSSHTQKANYQAQIDSIDALDITNDRRTILGEILGLLPDDLMLIQHIVVNKGYTSLYNIYTENKAKYNNADFLKKVIRNYLSV